VDANQLREINGIPRGMRIKPGSTVIIPKTAKNSDVPVHLANNAALMLEKEVAQKKAKSKQAKGKGAGNKKAPVKKANNDTPKKSKTTTLAQNQKKAN
jgi:membrane-bound lytic murein transglycosylase D